MARMWTALLGMVVLLVMGEPAKAAGEHLVALVIGNNDYQHANKLANAVTDARVTAHPGQQGSDFGGFVGS